MEGVAACSQNTNTKYEIYWSHIFIFMSTIVTEELTIQMYITDNYLQKTYQTF